MKGQEMFEHFIIDIVNRLLPSRNATELSGEQISVQGCGGSGRWVALLCKVWRLWRDEQLTDELFLQIFAESCAGPGRRCWVCGV